MYYIIYKITNKINQKYYIGKHQTADLDDGYMGSGKLIQRAIKKYGVECFTKEILHIFDNEAEMNAAEKELVVINEQTYNLAPGGRGGFGYIIAQGLNIKGASKGGHATNKIVRIKRQQDPEYDRKYLERKLKGAYMAKYTLQEKYPNGTFFGKKHTEETKRFIGQNASFHQQGEKNSQFGTCWITNGTENKKIKKTELESHESLGWRKGRVIP